MKVNMETKTLFSVYQGLECRAYHRFMKINRLTNETSGMDFPELRFHVVTHLTFSLFLNLLFPFITSRF